MNWNDVNERLPEVDVPVLGYSSYDKRTKIYYLTPDLSWGNMPMIKWVSRDYLEIELGWISHWMPLPEPPEWEEEK